MNTEKNKKWIHWERRRSKKINPLNFIYIITLCFATFFPILQSNFFWNEYDQITRSFYPELHSWKSIFTPTIFWNENPLALISYYLEGLLPFNDAFVHRFINILLHSCASILLYRLLNRLHISGAFIISLFFAAHPVVVHTLFWPGHRSNLIILCLILWCLYLALDRQNENTRKKALALSALAALIHPIAIIIPLCLFLNIFAKNKEFKLENFNKIIPYIITVFLLSILAETFENTTVQQISPISNGAQEASPHILYQFSEYFKMLYFPFDSAFFIPVASTIQTNALILFPILLFTSIYLFLFAYVRTIWARLIIMGMSLLIILLIYASCQKGLFLDGSLALDESLIYIALIPAIAIVIGSIHATIVQKFPKLALFWYSFSGLLILISVGTSISRGMQINGTLKLWEYFNNNWSQSIVPKQAISDYLFVNSYEKYDIKDHISFLELITEKDPEDLKRKIQLAQLYSKDKQNRNATKIYESIISSKMTLDKNILEEAARHFELQGLYREARLVRNRLDEMTE
ncbi:MAG: hypothetical protein DBX03_00235 [Puniceicoccaceae bacterium]|nr:MAG: hypothetical protein DBX03_00235 [Puniceicoccaceae bacterium]